MITEKIKRIQCDKTFRAKITGQISADKYKIFYKNKECTVTCDGSVNLGDWVWVCAPCNNWDDLYIQLGRSMQNQINKTNSNLALKADKSDLPYKATIISYYLSAFTAYGGSYYHDFTISNSGGGIPFLFSSISGANLSVNTSFTGVTATAFRAWASSNAAEAIINILVLIPK